MTSGDGELKTATCGVDVDVDKGVDEADAEDGT